MKKFSSSIFLLYLRICAKIQLLKFRPAIIGVGGSSGKSSVSLLIGEILSEKYKVKETMGKNSETGIPLSILGISPKKYNLQSWGMVSVSALVKILTNFKKYDFFVAEMGIDSPHPPKNMAYLLKIIKPKIAILTNISYEHSVYFEELINESDEKKRLKKVLDLITGEETDLLKSLKTEDSAIVNFDDENIKNNLGEVKAKIIKVSKENPDADLFIKNIKVSLDESSFTFQTGSKDYELELALGLPDFFAYSFALAIEVSLVCGISIDDSINAIKQKFALPPGRSSIFNGIKKTRIIDSSYNSSLEPASGMLHFLNEVSDKRRKLVILGDMREQGKQSRMLHEKLGREIALSADLAILIGPLMKKFVSPILEENNFNHKAFDTFSLAKDYILSEVKENDVILIKGSQNNLLLERAVELLLANKENIEKLCRRGEFWDKLRQSTP